MLYRAAGQCRVGDNDDLGFSVGTAGDGYFSRVS